MKKKITKIQVILIGLLVVWAVPPCGAFSWFFDTTEPPPDITEPVNGSRYTTGDLPPVIRWTAVSNADEYEIQFSVDEWFLTPSSLFTDDIWLDFSDFLDQAEWNAVTIQLFFQVRAIESGEPITDWSEWTEFAKTTASAPAIVSPVDDARFIPEQPLPVFEWFSNDQLDTFMIEFASDRDFENSYGAITIKSTLIDGNTTGDRDVWDALIGTFYWRVWGLEQGWVPTPPTASHRFSKTVITPPAPLTPLNQTRLASDSEMPIFQWEILPHNPDEYHIQFAYAQNSFPDGGAYIQTDDASFTFESVGITDAIWASFYGKLSWRVAGVDEYGNHGGFSEEFWFSKVSATNYMAYGDSVTGGWGASDFETGFAGYPRQLQNMLRAKYSDDINVFCEHNRSWFSGSHAYTGSANIANAMEYHGPKYALIMLGIVDIVDPGAPGCDNFDCHTIDHLSYIIDEVRGYQGTPFLATLPPVNPDSPRYFLQYHVDNLNDDIRYLAYSKNVQIAALDDAFFTAPLPLPSYYTFDSYNNVPDWAHFNDAGHMVIAEAWNQLL